MDSKTKTEIPNALIEEMVRAQFGSALKVRAIQALTSGWFNASYAISFQGAHPDLVLRVAPDPALRLLSYEKDMMRAELEVYELIQQLDVPTPQVYGYDLERKVIDRDYMFLARLSGLPLHDVWDSLDQENNDALQHQLGVYAARMHALHGPRFGYIGGQPEQAPSWRQAFLNMILALLDDGVALGAQLPLSYREIRALFTDLAYALDEIEQPSLVHWDLWPVNVFVIPDDSGRYTIEGIIDWERTFWGDPEAEAPLVTQHYGPSFFKGYGKELATGRSARIRQCMYRLYLWLIMVIEARVRFEEAEHLEWTRTRLEKDLRILRKYL